MKRMLAVASMFGILLAACATPAGPVVSEATATPVAPTSQPTQAPTGAPTLEPTVAPTAMPPGAPTGAPTVEPTHIPVDIPPVQRKAIDAAIAALGTPADQVKLVSIEPVDWPDGCLGVVHMGMMCTKGPVPGFRIVLETGGKQYEFHTNMDASVVVPSNGPAVLVPDAIVGPVKAALAAASGVALSDISVVSTQIIEWPDGCLGNATPGMACSQIVTPGYIVVLQAKGKQYEYHTNGDATEVKPASVALTWQRTGGLVGLADNLTVYQSGEIHADWGRPNSGSKDSTLSALSQDQQAQMQSWLAKFGSVSVQEGETPVPDQITIELTLLGSGSGQPSASEQQAMLDWSASVQAALQK